MDNNSNRIAGIISITTFLYAQRRKSYALKVDENKKMGGRIEMIHHRRLTSIRLPYRGYINGKQ